MFADIDTKIFDEKNSTYVTFDLLGKKWTIFILYLLCHRVLTFGAIQRFLPKMNAKLLSDRLDSLIKEGYIERNVTQNKPLIITYILTEKGIRLGEQIRLIGDITKNHIV